MIVLLSFTWVQNIIDTTNSEKTYKITLLGHNANKKVELEKIISDCKLRAHCISHAKLTSEMILTYSIQGSKDKHTNLVNQFYENSLVESFNC